MAGCLLARTDPSYLDSPEAQSILPTSHHSIASLCLLMGRVTVTKQDRNMDFLTLSALQHKILTPTGQECYCVTISFHHQYKGC